MKRVNEQQVNILTQVIIWNNNFFQRAYWVHY